MSSFAECEEAGAVIVSFEGAAVRLGGERASSLAVASEQATGDAVVSEREARETERHRNRCGGTRCLHLARLYSWKGNHECNQLYCQRTAGEPSRCDGPRT